MSGRWSDRPHGRELPSNWRTIHHRILRRDPHCRLHLPGCTLISTEVDHINDRDDHSDENLQGACHSCHAHKTAAEAAAGRAAARARKPKLRPQRPHPGFIQ